MGSCMASTPLNWAMATVTVCAAGLVMVKLSAKRYSFHELTNASSPVVTSAGASSGSRIMRKRWKGVAPSTMAACSISSGRPRKKLVSTQTVKGSVKTG